MSEDPTRMVTVCSACRCMTCWHGLFYCNAYRDAGIADVPRGELLAENREHASWLSDAKLDEYEDLVDDEEEAS